MTENKNASRTSGWHKGQHFERALGWAIYI